MKTTTVKTAPVKKAETTKPVDNYKNLVIGTNKNLKSFTKSTGGAIKLVLLLDDLHPRIKRTLKAIQKDNQMYKSFDNNIRKNKHGNTCPFYVLQAVYKGLNK
jgi:hypothetical protein